MMTMIKDLRDVVKESANRIEPAEIIGGTIRERICIADIRNDQHFRLAFRNLPILKALIGKTVESVELINEIDPHENPDGTILDIVVKVKD